ncbi:MAG: serine/threonine-protein kinase [Myxococcota bacterium]
MSGDGVDTGDAALAGTRLSQADGQALAPGVVLNGTYALEALLGKGGMGEVWKARHLRLPKSVAIKVLLPSMGGSGEIIARFQREAEIGARLAHPNIVHVFDFDALPDGRKYIAMDYLEGEPLADRMERGRIAFGETLAILTQATSGLRVAHEAGVVHRDLKPDNLFLVHEPNEKPPFRVKILDFGISKIQTTNVARTRDMAVMGTPGYMAPEQAMGKTKELGPEADQFALATMAYEMLTGRVAFTGQTVAEVVLKVVQETPMPVRQVVPDVPAAAAAAVARGMSKDPAQRFPDVASFMAAFRGEGAVDASASAPTMAAVGLPPSPLAAPAPAAVPAHANAAAGTAATGLATPAGVAPVAAAASVPAAAPASGGGGLLKGAAVGLLVAALAGGAYVATRPSDDPGAVGTGGERETGGPATGTTEQASMEAQTADATPTMEEATGNGAADPDAAGDDTDESAMTTTTAGAALDTAAMDTAAMDTAAMDTAAMAGTMRGIPPEAQALLDQANAALRAGNGRQAGQLAERSYGVHRSRQAQELMAKAACHERNIGLVTARMRPLSRSARRRVANYCQRFGLNPAP